MGTSCLTIKSLICFTFWFYIFYLKLQYFKDLKISVNIFMKSKLYEIHG